MAWRQYSSCRTVRRMGTFAPAWSQPSGQEFLCLNPGLVVFWRLVMAPAPQRESRWLSPPAQTGRGRAATEPHHGGAARRSLRYGHGSWGRTSGSRKDVEMCGVVAEPGELAPDGIPNRERTMRDDRLLRHGMRRGGDGEGHALGQPRPDLIEHGAKASALAEGLPRPMRSGRQVRGRCGHARFSGGQLPGMTSRRWPAAP